MGPPATAEGSGLPKEVIICRFGSAYSTLTVFLHEKKAYDEIQQQLKEFEAANELKEPVLEPGQRVVFKDYEGNWVRARIRTVHDDGAQNDPTVDLVLEITKEIYTRVSAKTLMALPTSFQPRKHAFPYFIAGLQPYNVTIAHKDASNSVSAQRCADVLNDIWKSQSRIAILEDLMTPQEAYIRSARFTRIFVATLTLEGSMNLSSFVKRSLMDYLQKPYPDRQVYFESVRHPDIIPNGASSVLVPEISETGEPCEVVSLRKNRDGSLRVGLRLLRYLDQELLFDRLLGGPARHPRDETIGPLSPVCINLNDNCVQRGVVLKTGKVLGIDTLEIFDPEEEDVELCGLTHSLADVFPHLGLFIDWYESTSGPTPCLGDLVVATNLRPQREHEELFLYLYDDVKILDEATVIGGRDVRVRGPEQRKAAQIAKPNKKLNKRTISRTCLAEWYGLSSELAPFYSEIYEDHPMLPSEVEVLFSEFAVIVPLCEL